MNSITDHIECVWLIGCSRCANEGTTIADTVSEAGGDFLRSGWTKEGHRIFCPACNGERR